METTSTPGTPTRRALLAGLLGGIGAWAASAVGRAAPAQAAVGDPIRAGQTTAAGSAKTQVTNNSSTNHTFVAVQNGTGTALRGTANSGIGGRFYTSAKNKFGLVAGNTAAGPGDGAAIQANGNHNNGIVAYSDDKTGIVVFGAYNGIETYSEINNGNGIYSQSNGNGSSFGVYGITHSADGGAIGVYGHSTAASAGTRGVKGVSDSTSGVGVEGFGGWTGVYGGTGDEAAGWAGYFTADVNVDGILYGGTVVTRVDDPESPTTRWLQHAGVESTERLRISAGTVTLDARGEATVRLPAWYAGQHADARYQLTAIGAAAPDLHVSSELDAAGAFAIAGGAAGQKVSWQLTSTRDDAFARAHPLVTQPAKGARDVGTLKHPTLYGEERAAHPAPKAALSSR